MTRWMFIALLALTGCPTGTDTPLDTDSSDSDGRDTDGQPDTGWGNQDTDVSDTDVSDTDADTDAGDTDSGFGGSDTAICHFGEVEDCNGTCYPEYFLGDGYCDDGDPLPADFDCSNFNFDRGDCAADTDTVPSGSCGYIIRLHLFYYPSEAGWRLEDSTGAVLASVAPGTYTQDNSVYEYPIDLADGSYSFIGIDANSDTWDGGGWWEILEVRTGRQIYEGRGFPYFQREFTWNFNATCSDGVGCDIDMRTLGGSDAPDMGWELYTAGSGLLWAQRTVSSVVADTTADDVIHVFDGPYTFRSRDSKGDGWDGRVEARYPGGLLMDTFGLATGVTSASNFTVVCGDAGSVAFDAPGAPLQPTNCADVVIQMETGSHGSQVGWSLYQVDGWSLLANRNAGQFADNNDYRVDVALPASGLYFLRMTDSGSDGWEGGKIRVRNPLDAGYLLQMPMPTGGSTGKYFRVACPLITDTDPDSGADTSPTGTCAPGAVRDCTNVCWPSTYLGDGSCDDGTTFAANFNCAAYTFDHGDCSQP